MTAHILIIDDDAAIRRTLRTSLLARDYRVSVAATGAEGLDLLHEEQPDLVLLDLGLPDMDGLEVCTAIRSERAVPILVLSARLEEEEKVALLDAGANDYIVKPYGTNELLARIRAALRLPTQTVAKAAPQELMLGALRLDLACREAHIGEVTLALTPTEWDILAFFAQAGKRVVTYDEVCRAVWGEPAVDRLPSLQMYLSQIRAKVERYGATLPVENMARRGYRLVQ